LLSAELTEQKIKVGPALCKKRRIDLPALAVLSPTAVYGWHVIARRAVQSWGGEAIPEPPDGSLGAGCKHWEPLIDYKAKPRIKFCKRFFELF
jgi:hypothetical protein